MAKLLALVQNYLVWNQNTGSYRIVPKINFVFYSKGSTEPISLNPRPAGVWLVTRPAGGGPKGPPPPEISQTTGPISKFQTPFDSPVRELPVQGQKFDPEVTDDVTDQVKVRIFDFSGLVTSASKMSMLSANKANESAWIVSLTSVSIISCALWPYLLTYNNIHSTVAILVEVTMIHEWSYYSWESEKDLDSWVGVGHVTVSAAAAQWRCTHLQSASG